MAGRRNVSDDGDWFGYRPDIVVQCRATSSGRSATVRQLRPRDVGTRSSTDLCLAGDLGQAVPFGLIAAVDARRLGERPDLDRGRPRGRPLVRQPGLAPCSTSSTTSSTTSTSAACTRYRARLPAAARRDDHAEPAVAVPGRGYRHVYAFDGTAGQEVVGEAEGDDADYYTRPGSSTPPTGAISATSTSSPRVTRAAVRTG